MGMMIPGCGPGSLALSSGSILFISVELDLRSRMCTQRPSPGEERDESRGQTESALLVTTVTSAGGPAVAA